MAVVAVGVEGPPRSASVRGEFPPGVGPQVPVVVPKSFGLVGQRAQGKTGTCRGAKLDRVRFALGQVDS